MMSSNRLIPIVCFLSGLLIGTARAEDSIRIAQPDDVQAFDAAVSKKLGKTDSTSAPIASELPAVSPSASATPSTVTQPAAASSVPAQNTARQEIIAQAIRALKKNDVQRFQSLLTAEAKNKIGTPDAIARFQEALKNNKDLQLADETVMHSIEGKQPDGSTKPILQLFSEAVRHKDAAVSAEPVMTIQVLCGTKSQGASCLIQDFTVNGS